MLSGNWDKFEKSFDEMKVFSSNTAVDKFALAEFKRFYSIAGTIRGSFKNVATNIDERIITHILLRSLIENFFWITYLYDKSRGQDRDSEFDKYLNSFRKEYDKLYTSLLIDKSNLETPVTGWNSLPSGLDLNSVITQVMNDHGNRLSYLYSFYRIASFDTHGKTLEPIFESVFGKNCNFPFIKHEKMIDLISNQYLVVFEKIKKST